MFNDMKRFRPSEANAVDATRVGEELRDARLALGWDIQDVATQLRIRRVYLVALEEGRIGDLPSPAYAIGFIRNYAALLGLDSNDIVRRFRDAATGVVARRSDLVFPEPVPERGFPTGVVLLLGAVIAVGSYVAWYNWSGSGERVVDAVPPVPTRLDPAVRDGEALRPPRVAQAPTPAPPPPAPTAQPGAQPGPGLPPLPVPTPVPVQVPPPPPAPAAQAPATPAPPAANAPIVLRFRGDAWTEVRAPGNRVLLSRVMRAGESWEVPAGQAGLTLATGAGQNMEILVGGRVVPFSTDLRGVRRNIPLEPRALMALPAQ
ncbi:MAG TPA: RodZ domain-containing protein [Roseococcus sp.]|nr:RodZ domain-containing protein [Roseococcus sp.]